MSTSSVAYRMSMLAASSASPLLCSCLGAAARRPAAAAAAAISASSSLSLGARAMHASASSSTSPSSSSRRPATGTDPGKLYRERQATGGAFTWRAAAVFIVTGGGLYFYFQNEKKKIEERKRQEVAAQKVGRPKIGGPFKLTDQNGKEFTHEDLLGKHSLVYFGFTNCPDICPEELDKMTLVVNDLVAKHGQGSVLPVFITCDPARDSVAAIKEYCKDFHPSLVGLTGSYDDIKRTCKTYRVYFSTPPNTKPGEDYLVDHSIFFYLMDPTGQFVDAFGRSATQSEVVAKVDTYMKEWKAGVRREDA